MNTDKLVSAGKTIGLLVLGIVAGETVSTYLVKKALPDTMSAAMKSYVPFGLAAGAIALNEMTEVTASSPELKTMTQGFAIGCANNGLREMGLYSKINTGLGLQGFAGIDTLGSPAGSADDILFEDDAYLEHNELSGGYATDYSEETQIAELGTGSPAVAANANLF